MRTRHRARAALEQFDNLGSRSRSFADQQLNHMRGAGLSGGAEGRGTRPVDAVDVRARREQLARRVHVAARRRHRERRLASVPGSVRRDARVDECTERADLAAPRRGMDRLIALTVRRTRRRAAREQQTRRFRVPDRRVQRRVALGVARVEAGAGTDQQLEERVRADGGGDVQRRLAGPARRVHRRALAEQLARLLDDGDARDPGARVLEQVDEVAGGRARRRVAGERARGRAIGSARGGRALAAAPPELAPPARSAALLAALRHRGADGRSANFHVAAMTGSTSVN